MRQQEKANVTEAPRPARILVVEDEPNMVAGLRDNFLVRLRQKLEPDPEQPQYFLTVHGTGYRFVG